MILAFHAQFIQKSIHRETRMTGNFHDVDYGQAVCQGHRAEDYAPRDLKCRTARRGRWSQRQVPGPSFFILNVQCRTLILCNKPRAHRCGFLHLLEHIIGLRGGSSRLMRVIVPDER